MPNRHITLIFNIIITTEMHHIKLLQRIGFSCISRLSGRVHNVHFVEENMWTMLHSCGKQCLKNSHNLAVWPVALDIFTFKFLWEDIFFQKKVHIKQLHTWQISLSAPHHHSSLTILGSSYIMYMQTQQVA